MSTFHSAVAGVILAGIVSVLALPVALGRSSASLASLALGTDDAFSAYGLEPRENQIGGGAIRWLRPKAAFQFDSVGPGFVDVDLEIRGHRTEVTLIANGARVGNLPPGQGHFASRIRLLGASLMFGIETEGFPATGRTLGAQFVSLRVEPKTTPPPRIRSVPIRFWLALTAVAAAAWVAQALSGLSLPLALLPPATFLTLVLPMGLWRSAWLIECASLVALASMVSSFAARKAVGTVAARGWLQGALLIALAVHGVLPPSPLIVQADAQLHGNKLAEVASGNPFPTSRTDHKPPFEIPYGFSFYGLLSPWASAGAANVAVVRHGAAFLSALSALCLALLLGRVSAGLAAASLLLWTFSPVNIRTMAYGNLSNVFAQGVFVLFLVGAALPLQGRVRTGLLALSVALSATAHLSSFIFQVALFVVALFIPKDRREAALKPLLLGMVLAALYYASFLRMIWIQLPRLLAERGGSGGVFDPWRLPSQILSGAGGALLGLILLSAVAGTLRPVLPFSRSLALCGLLLAVAALVSPVEVRYLFAVLPVLAAAGASALGDSPGVKGPRSERWVRPLALGLTVWAVVTGAQVLRDFLPLFGV